MPNHVTTLLRASREVVHALLTEGGVDFNRIIPSPPEDDEMFTVERRPIYDADGKIVAVGYGPGYSPLDWCRYHWGTKWNAYSDSLSEDDTVVQFDTAWSHPYPVIHELSQRFPDELIEVAYADEDLGHNFDAYTVRGGVSTERPMPDEGTSDGDNMASLIKYGIPYEALEAGQDVPALTAAQVLDLCHLSTPNNHKENQS